MDKLKLHSTDFTAANIAKLAELFPNCVTETRDEQGGLQQAIDFDLLKQELSTSVVEGAQERYQLNWPGKREALLTANAPIAKTLRPVRSESVDFDSTQNLYIEGDNLDALKLLQETYLGKVKMIYIDPPYNTGNDFIYDDDFAEDTGSYLVRSNQKDDVGNRLVANNESNGRFHSDWLSMMYPRLKLARNLLRDDGVIFISIDDGEASNLRRLCDEIFGEVNFFAQLIRRAMHTVRNSSKDFNLHADYVLCYAKNKSWWAEDKSRYIRHMVDKSANYTNDDKDGRGVYKFDPLHARNYAKPYVHTFKNGVQWKAPKGRFPTYSIETLTKMEADNRIDFSAKEPRMKRYLSEVQAGQPPNAILNPEDVGFNTDGTKLLSDTLGVDKIFSQPKPIELVKFLSTLIRDENALTLDFFSGSATAAHAVMQLNAEDNGKRRFIMVQLPEACDEKSEAFKAGYLTIAEIGKERIRRAGQKILQEIALKNQDEAKQANVGETAVGEALASTENEALVEAEASPTKFSPIKATLDIGFRVLKIDSSNMKDVYYTPDQLTQADLDKFTDNIKDDRSAEDLLFQVLLDWGVDLTLPIRQETIAGKSVLFVDDNALAACFESDINETFVKALSQRQPLRVVFRDDGFASDSVKINIEQIFKLLSPQTEIKTI